MTQQDQPTASTGEGPRSAPVLDGRDPAFRADPHGMLDDLRAREPVHRDAGFDRIVVTSADRVAEVLADRTLSSDPRRARPGSFGRETYTDRGRDTMSFLIMDDPAHARLRRLVASAFNARAVGAMRPEIEDACAGLLDGIDPAEPFELITCFESFPVLVVAGMLGFDGVDARRVHRWLRGFVRPQSTRSERDELELAADYEWLDGSLSRLLEERRRRPREDLLSSMAAAGEGGDRLSAAEILGACRLLVLAGAVTTDLIGNGAVALLRHPAQLAALRAEPALWPAAVEEILRFDPPVASRQRYAVEARRIGDCPVEAGQTVTAMLIAANHDPHLNRDPHRFDIARGAPRHVSFGGGAHFCLGASLARLEGHVALAALFGRFRDLRLDPAHVPERRPHPAFNGFRTVWLRAS